MFAPAAFAGVLTWQGTCIDCTQPLGSESNASALINVSGGTPVGLGRTNFDAVFGEILDFSYQSDLFEFSASSSDLFAGLLPNFVIVDNLVPSASSTFLNGIGNFTRYAGDDLVDEASYTAFFSFYAGPDDIGYGPASWELIVDPLSIIYPEDGIPAADIGFGSSISATAVPIPGTFALFGFGLLGMTLARRRRISQ